MNTVAASGIGQMFKDVMLNAGTAYGGELGEALAEANRAIGAGRAAMENLADSYTQEALSAVLTGSETSLQWSDDNAQRL